MKVLLALTVATVFAQAQEGKCYMKNRKAPEPPKEEPKPSEKLSEPAPAGASQGGALGAHNMYRNREGVPPLQWSTKLEASAKRWANTMASYNSMFHSTSGYGENLAVGADCVRAVTMWYDEKPYFPGRMGRNFDKYGHFTQVIWRRTTHVGCASTGRFCVCQYEPSGNRMGESPYA